MRSQLLFPVAAALALAACNSEPEPAPEATQTAAPAPAPMPTEIPAAFQGRFGLVPADCTGPASDAKGLMEISADQLKFYESVGKLDEITQATDARIRGSFSFSGEGQTWKRENVLVLQDGGKLLVRREFGEDAAIKPFAYTRCE